MSIMRKKHSTAPSRWTNPIKDKLKRGESVFGIVITINNVEVAAQAAAMGFDFLWLEMEHTPLTLDTVRNIVLATRGLPAVPFARPPVNELWTAKRVLDAGVLGVIFPFTSNAALARQAVSGCRYPPAGLRGSGADLAAFRWPAPEGYYDFADKNVVVVTIVEDLAGLSNIEEIAETPGIDVIFIGTSDLSFALGLRGEQNHPKLEAAVTKIAAAAKKHGKAVGRPAITVKDAKAFQKKGFQFFFLGSDVDFLRVGASQVLTPLGRSLKPATTAPI
jgi:2-keto-3-deoxy-L-rhamnonate aldolase RhmA